MKIFAHKSKSNSRRSTGIVLLVGVLAGATVGGGVGVFAASETKSVTVCANKKTNMLRYSKNGKCTKTETKVELNQTGTDGISGPAGAKGDTGPAGPAGPAGASGSGAITQLKVCDGTDAGTTADELCKIGMTGPGGGHIFFVDYNDQYAGFNYLEAAPAGWGNGIAVISGETTGTLTKDPILNWCSETETGFGFSTWKYQAVGAGSTITNALDNTCTNGAIRAALDYVGGTKTDWFLPSYGELMMMNFTLAQAGVGDFEYDLYVSSSEKYNEYYHGHNFSNGNMQETPKMYKYLVRPARAF